MYLPGILKEQQFRALFMKSALFGTCLFTLFFVLLSVSGCNENSSSFSAGLDASGALIWDAPTTNEDGSTLTDLAGYRVHYGTTSGNYPDHIDVGNVTTYSILSLPAGTYYFVVTASNTSGVESVNSNQVIKVVP